MVDQTGSNRKMICFPALGHDCPSFLQCSAISHRDYVEQLQITSVTALDQWKETTADLNRGIIKEESGFSCPRNDWQSGFGKFAGMKCERPQSVIFIGGEVPTQLSYAPVEVEALGAGSGNDVSLDFQSFSHEDTDDLEALLSSDDELSSTGHSPSDVSPSNSPMLSNGYCMDDSSLNSGKKRKRDVINYCSDGDAESSTATSTFVQLDYLKDSGADIFPAVSGRESATFKQCRHTGSCEEVTAFAVRFPNETSSRNESAKHRAVYKKAPPEKKRPAKRARKKKIRQTFQMLRHIIPGGDCMNTAFVLGEAIQYVKSLQVKVQRLEAKKLL